MTYFSGPEICMQPFIDMDVSIRLQAIAWMVRDKPRISIVTSEAIIALKSSWECVAKEETFEWMK